jgi:hypothetical protein
MRGFLRPRGAPGRAPPRIALVADGQADADALGAWLSTQVSACRAILAAGPRRGPHEPRERRGRPQECVGRGSALRRAETPRGGGGAAGTLGDPAIDEAADYARTSRQRIYDLRSARRLSCVGDGSRGLVLRSELDDLISNGSKG